ncbi:Ig-like domain-containing protein [Limnoglobus roseus]|uniref:Tandem repeat protein n=1 Tax=Limnoglobus roseus TaxID=2598579 RepID=A0A5C1A8R5_9BACT|nr:Ig-like domain-containing protein [Limnoglobus roseus]QEL14583.1 tandem repeat protein [Limnoglobus roseus]
MPAGLTPVVTPPGIQFLAENGTLNFGSANTFSISDRDNSSGLYTAKVAVTHGIAKVTAPLTGAVLVSNNNSSLVTITGTLANLNASLIVDGFLKFTPDPFYPTKASGDANVSVTVTDPQNNSGSGQTNVRVIPVPQQPTLTTPTGLSLRPGGTTPLGLALDPSLDTDGSESYYVDFSSYPTEGTFSSAGTILPNGSLRFPASAVPNLAFTLPSDFPTGPVSFTVSTYTIDSTNYPLTGGSITSELGWPAQTFNGTVDRPRPVVRPPAAQVINENDSLTFKSDEGGNGFSFSDADALDAQGNSGIYQVSISATNGSISIDVNAASEAGLTPGVFEPFVTLSGTYDNLNRFLGRSGSDGFGFTYVPTPYFSGVAQVSMTVTDPDGQDGSDYADVLVKPVADPPTLTVPADTIVIPPDGSASLDITAAVPFDTFDKSESVSYIDLTSYPAGAFTDSNGLIVGGPSPSGFGWRVTPNQLPGLMFFPDSSVGGNYTIGVHAVSTDVAQGFGGDIIATADSYATIRLQIQTAPKLGLPFVGFVESTPGVFESNNADAAFYLQDFDDAGGTYTLTLTLPAGAGDFSVDDVVAGNYGVSVSGSGTESLTLTGPLGGVNGVRGLQGLTSDGLIIYTPTQYLSGDLGNITGTLTDPDGYFSTSTRLLEVVPVADPPILTATAAVNPPFVTADDPMRIQTVAGRVSPPVPLTVTATPVDTNGDGQEQVKYVEVFFYNYQTGNSSLGTLNYGSGSDSSGYVQLTPDQLGNLSFTVDPSVAPGDYYLQFYGFTQDQAVLANFAGGDLYTTDYSPRDGGQTIVIHIEGPPVVTSPPVVSTPENKTFDFAGQVAVGDDDNDPYSYSPGFTATFSTTGGTLSFDSYSATYNYGLSVDASTPTTFTLSGSLNNLNNFLSFGGGAFQFVPTPYLSGPQFVTITVTDSDGNTTAATTEVDVLPVANRPVLTVASPAGGPAGSPISLSISARSPDQDGSEAVSEYRFSGYPDGTIFSLGTDQYFPTFDDLTGQYYTSIPGPTLTGLTVTLPADAGEGTFALTVQAKTHDHASFPPDTDDVTSDSPYATRTLVVDTRTGPVIDLPDGLTTYEHSPYSGYYLPAFQPTSVFDATPSDFGNYTYHVHLPDGILTTNADPATSFANYGVTIAGYGTFDLTYTGDYAHLVGDPNNLGFLSIFSTFVQPKDYLSGGISLSATFTAPDGRFGTDATTVFVYPVAAFIAPGVVPDIAGGVGETIPFPIVTADTPDQDGSESVEVLITGLPPGATLSAVPAGPTGGFTRSQLVGLTLTLPADAVVGDTYTLTVTARVTDRAGSEIDTQEQSATVVVHIVSVPPFIRPTVNAPGVGDPQEGNDVWFHYVDNGNNNIVDNSFQIADRDDNGGRYTVYFNSDRGYVSYFGVDSKSPGHTVTPSYPFPGVNTLALTGTLPELNAFLKAGIYENRNGTNYYYSGDDRVTVSVVDPDGLVGTNEVRFRVLPVAFYPDCVLISPYITGDVGAEIPTPIATDPTPDTDGSEEMYALISATYADGSSAFADGAAFTLGTPVNDTQWRVNYADFANLKLLPPVGFDGQIYLSIQLVVEDHADYPSFPHTDPRHHQDAEPHYAYASSIVTVATGGYPRVTTPGVQSIREGGNAADPNDPRPSTATFAGPTALSVSGAGILTVTLTVQGYNLGTLHVIDPTNTFGVTVTGDDSPTLTLTGFSEQLEDFFLQGFEVVPTDYYSGDIIVEVRADREYYIPPPFAPGNSGYGYGYGYGLITLTDYAGLTVKVSPVVSPANVTVNNDSPDEVRAPSAPYSLAGGFVTVTPWPDRDYSEYGYVQIDLSGQDTAVLDQFTLTSSFGGFYKNATGQWFTYGYVDPATVQSVLDSITLTPPAGFGGRVTFTAKLGIYDGAHFTSDCTYEYASAMDVGSAVFNFVTGPTVTLNPVSISEGDGVADLGGLAAVQDPSGEATDQYALTLTLTPPAGSPFVVFSVDPEGLPSGVSLFSGNGTTEVTLTGTLAGLQGLGSTFGAVTLRMFGDNPGVSDYFSGLVPITATFVNTTTLGVFPTSTASSAVVVYPVATRVNVTIDPIVAIALQSDQFQAVPVNVTLSPLDPDGTETALVTITGVNGTFNHGSSPDGGVTWQFTRNDLVDDLADLMFTPTGTGEQHWSVTVSVTDTADLSPDVLPPNNTDTAPPVSFDLDVTVIRVVIPDITVPENTPEGAAVGVLQVFGLPADADYDFSLVPNDGDHFAYNFTVDPDGTIRVGDQNPDFESGNPNVFTLSVLIRQYVSAPITFFARPAGFGQQFGFGPPTTGDPFFTVNLGTFTVPVVITNVAEPPTESTSPTITGLEDTTVNVTGLSFTADDAAGAPVTVTLTATHGMLTVNGIADGLNISAVGSPATTITISGSVSTINFLLGQDGVLTFTPDAQYGGPADFIATIDDRTGINPVTTVDTPFLVQPVADTPFVTPTGTNVTVPPNTAGPLGLSNSFNTADTINGDGSESVAVYITGVPAGFTLTNGFDQGGGVYLLTSFGQLDGLALIPPTGFTGTVPLTVYAIVTDVGATGTPPSAVSTFTTASSTFNITFAAANPPSGNTPFVLTGFEDNTSNLLFALVISAPDARNTQTGQADPVNGRILATFTVDHGTLSLDTFYATTGLTVGGSGNTLTLEGSVIDVNRYLSKQPAAPILYTPDANFAGVDNFHLKVSDFVNPTYTPQAIPFSIRPVADVVVGDQAAGVPASGRVNTPIPLTLNGSFVTADTDGSEKVTFRLTGVPVSATNPTYQPLNHGTNLGGGVWELTQADLVGLTFTPMTGFVGTINLTVESVVTDTVTIVSGPASSILRGTPAPFALTFTAPQPPTALAYLATPATEDTPVNTPFYLSFSAPDAVNGQVSVTLAVTHGVLNFSTFLNTLTVTNSGSPTVTITGPVNDINFALSFQARSLTFIPNAQYGGPADFTATINDFVNAPVNTTANLPVRPVADAVATPTGASMIVPAGTIAPVVITASFTTIDTDLSESVALYVFGVPADARLTNGTRQPDGSWLLTSAGQLDNLFLVLSDASFFVGTITLNVRAVVTDVGAPGTPPFSVSTATFDGPAFTLTFGQAQISGPFPVPPTPDVPDLTNSLTEDQLPPPAFFFASLSAPLAVNGRVTVTVSVVHGQLNYDSPDPAVIVDRINPRSLILTGPLSLINGIVGGLSTGIQYSPDANFAGTDFITLTLNDFVTNPVTSADVPFGVYPVADIDTLTPPTAASQKAPPNTTVPLDLSAFFTTADTDTSETVTLRISGVPVSANNPNYQPFNNHGTNLGGGVWELTEADYLAGITFTPPTGFVGTLNLAVRAHLVDMVTVPVSSGAFVTATDMGDTADSPFTLTFVVPQPPTVVGPNTITGREDTPTTITGLGFTAPDAPGLVEVTLSVTHGTLDIQPSFSPLSVHNTSPNTITFAGGDAAAVSAYLALHPLTFTPDPNYAGLATFTASINDFRNPATTRNRSFVITPVADPVGPSSGSDFIVNTGLSAPFILTGPTTTVDTDGSETVVFLASGVPAGATLSNAIDLHNGFWQIAGGNPAVSALTPPAEFVGTINLNVRSRVIDTVVVGTMSGGAFITATDTFDTADSPFTITFVGVTLPPTLAFTGGSVNENTPTGTFIGQVSLVANAEMPTGELFTFSLVEATGYDFTVTPDGRVLVGTQSPDFESLNTGSVTVKATGSHGTFVIQTFPISILNVNESPVFHGPAITDPNEDTPLAITGLSVGDPDAGALPVRVTLSVSHGTLAITGGPVTVSGNGGSVVTLTGSLDQLNALFAAANGIVYTPTGDYSGADSFAVFVDDLGNSGSGSPLSASGSFAFSVIAVADLPTLSVADAVGNEGGVIPLALTAAATDVDGSEVVTVRISGLPAGYTLSAGTRDPITGDWVLLSHQLANLTLTAPQDSGGTIPLTVVATAAELSNGVTASVTRTLNLTVRNVAPVITGLAGGTVTAGQPLTVSLGSFADPGAEPVWTATIDFGDGTPAVNFTANAPGSLGSLPHTYAAAGSYTITVRVFDGTDTGTATTTMEVTPIPVVNAPPVARDDAVRTAFGTPVAVGVLGNDTDPDGDPLTVLGVTTPANGVVTVGEDGVPVYTPNAGFSGTDSFQYTISDGHGHTATATVTVTVDAEIVIPPDNVAPVAGDDLVATPNATAVTFDVLHNDTDADGDTLAIIAVGTPAHGTVSFTGGQLIYTPDADFSGTETFTYTITDGHDHTATATATVVVRAAVSGTDVPPVPPPPISPSPLDTPQSDAAAFQLALTNLATSATRAAPSQTPPVSNPNGVSIPLVANGMTSAAGSGISGDVQIPLGTAPVGFLVLAPSEVTPSATNTGRLAIDMMPVLPADARRAPTINNLATYQPDRPPNTVFPLDPTAPTAGFGESEGEPLPFLDELYRKHLGGAEAPVGSKPPAGGTQSAAPVPAAPPPAKPTEEETESQAPAPAEQNLGPAWGALAFLGAVAVAAAPLSNIFCSNPDIRRRFSLTGTSDEDES